MQQWLHNEPHCYDKCTLPVILPYLELTALNHVYKYAKEYINLK